MDSPILILTMLSLSICLGLTEHGSHTILVEGYETKLQDLGQHVEVPETPVRVVKITKTIAVKVPVPYPVKVIEKVPYPVHVNRPYPVPVPQIVKVPQPAPHHQSQIQQHHALDIGHSAFPNIQGNTYSVQEGSSYNSEPDGHYEIADHNSDSYSSPLHTDSADGSPSYYGSSNHFGGDQDDHNYNVDFKNFNIENLSNFNTHH